MIIFTMKIGDSITILNATYPDNESLEDETEASFEKKPKRKTRGRYGRG